MGLGGTTNGATGLVEPAAPWAETKAAFAHLPYVGPDPAASRRLGRVVAIAAAIDMALRLRLAVAFVSLARFDERLAEQALQGGASAHIDLGRVILPNELAENVHRIEDLRTPQVIAWIATVILLIVWLRIRRPHARLMTAGETHVETHHGLLGPPWLLKGAIIVAAGGFALRYFGSPPADPTLDDLAFYRWCMAGSHVLWAAVYVALILYVYWSERSVRERRAMALGLPAGRPVPYASPVAAVPNPVHDGAEGASWVLIKFGRFMIGATAFITGYCGIALAFVKPWPANVGWALLGLAAGAFLFRRRLFGRRRTSMARPRA